MKQGERTLSLVEGAWEKGPIRKLKSSLIGSLTGLLSALQAECFLSLRDKQGTEQQWQEEGST
jgi:hypothetical protein